MASGAVRLRLRQAGFETYLVGGCVRDLLLGWAPTRPPSRSWQCSPVVP